MASFPLINFDPDDIKIRYLEPFASEALDKRFLGLPLGVYEGFMPSAMSPLVNLATSSRGCSLVRVLSGISKTSLDIIIEADISLDFTGHDFDASGDIYIVAKVNYLVGSPSTAQVITTNAAPIGNTEIGIARVTGTGVGTVLTVEFAATPDRHTPLADGFNPLGFMPTGSVQAIADLQALVGNCDVDATVRSASFAPAIADVAKLFLLDMGAIGVNETISLPASAGLVEGNTFSFLSLTGIPGGFDVIFSADGADEIVDVGAAGATATMRKHAFHLITFVLITTGVTNPTWIPKVLTLSKLHGPDHQLGGEDAIRLDDLAAPQDNTDLNATISAHGLLPKLSGNATDFLNGVGGFSPPGGATSGANKYIFKVVTQSTISEAILADGEVHIMNPPGGMGQSVYDLPSGLSAATGDIARIYFLQDAPVFPNNVAIKSASAFFNWNGVLVNGNTTGLISDFRRGQFLEFTFQKVVGGNLWVCTANTQVDEHRLRHGASGQDPLDVTTLAGFPAIAPLNNFLREDGTFAYPAQVVFAARSTAGGSPVNWNVIDINRDLDPGVPVVPEFDVTGGGTLIEVPSAGNYLIWVCARSTTGGTLRASIEVNAVLVQELFFNAGGGNPGSVTPLVGVVITDPPNELIRVTSANLFTAGSSIIIMKVG